MINGLVDNNTLIYVSLTEGLDLNKELSKIKKNIDSCNKYIDGLNTKMNKEE